MDENNTQMPVHQNGSNGTASLVLGIISLCLVWFGYSALVGFILSLIGLVLANSGKKKGDTNCQAGFVLSIIGLVLNSLSFIACVLCVGALSMM